MAREDRKVEFEWEAQAAGDKRVGWLRLPARWLRKMHVHPKRPDVALFFDGEKITIEQTKTVGSRHSLLAGRARLHRFALGFDMDCGQSLERALPGVACLFESRVFANHVAKLDVQTLGNAIFSRWRRWTHWDESPLDEDGWAWFVVALKRLAKLTEEDKA